MRVAPHSHRLEINLNSGSAQMFQTSYLTHTTGDVAFARVSWFLTRGNPAVAFMRRSTVRKSRSAD